jgi:hypothetical protein
VLWIAWPASSHRRADLLQRLQFDPAEKDLGPFGLGHDPPVGIAAVVATDLHIFKRQLRSKPAFAESAIVGECLLDP